MTWPAPAGAANPQRGGVVSRASFDDILGDPTKRYLSHRYRLVTHTILAGSSAVDSLAASERRNVIGSVAYPDNWSEKPGGSMPPHLSSLDGLTLGAMLTCLRSRAGAPTDDPAGPPVLTAIRIRAGALPETDLEAVPVKWNEAIGSGKRLTNMRFGRMSVSTGVEAASALPSLTDAAVERIGVQRWSNPSCSEARATEIKSEIVGLDPAQGTLTSEHKAAESSNELALGYDDFLRLSAQAAQILIYSFDGVDRDVSTNVWMRSADFALNPLAEFHDGPARMRSRIAGSRSLARGDTRFRTFDMEFELDGLFACTASLAYSA
ncbi:MULTISPECIES: AvrD family protein [Brevibacterium]|uniref:AvrD family protein n=1 Tax=Brevibacterium TaxID=1696 RepID=UPI0004AEE8B2|nr:AvrD family protein [Brevibacterium antiquum]